MLSRPLYNTVYTTVDNNSCIISDYNALQIS